MIATSTLTTVITFGITSFEPDFSVVVAGVVVVGLAGFWVVGFVSWGVVVGVEPVVVSPLPESVRIKRRFLLLFFFFEYRIGVPNGVAL